MVTLALLQTHVYDKVKEAHIHTHAHKTPLLQVLDIYAVVPILAIKGWGLLL